MAASVSKQMASIQFYLKASLIKTLASKLKISVAQVYRQYGMVINGYQALKTIVERENKGPLVATLGGFSIKRIPDGVGNKLVEFNLQAEWYRYGWSRAELVQRLVAGECELCGAKNGYSVHHIRALADLDKPGRRPKTRSELLMSARKRQTLVVCPSCHHD